MSPAVAVALEALPTLRTVIAARPDAPSMAEAAGGLFDAALQLEGEGGDR
jgi:hypothetical protein